MFQLVSKVSLKCTLIDTFIFCYYQNQYMGDGDLGVPGPSVLYHVEQGRKDDLDSVTVPYPPLMVDTVMITICRKKLVM